MKAGSNQLALLGFGPQGGVRRQMAEGHGPNGWGPAQWEMNIDDVVGATGPLVPTFGEVLVNRTWEMLKQDRSRDTEHAPGDEIYRIPIANASCMEAAFDSSGMHCYLDRNRSDVPDDSYLALAEYQSADPGARSTSLGATGVAVEQFYIMCAHHVSTAAVPVGKKFDRYDLFLCGIRLSFTVSGTDNIEVIRSRILSWLIERYALSPQPPGAEAVQAGKPAVAADPPTTGQEPTPRTQPQRSDSRSHDLDRYRWCTPPDDSEVGITPCPASITFALDRATRTGTILLMTQWVYRYLHVRRHYTGMTATGLRPLNGPTRYFAILFARPERYASGRGSYLCALCGPDHFRLSDSLRARLTLDPEPAVAPGAPTPH